MKQVSMQNLLYELSGFDLQTYSDTEQKANSEPAYWVTIDVLHKLYLTIIFFHRYYLWQNIYLIIRWLLFLNVLKERKQSNYCFRRNFAFLITQKIIFYATFKVDFKKPGTEQSTRGEPVKLVNLH